LLAVVEEEDILDILLLPVLQGQVVVDTEKMLLALPHS
jgi:hypothetical protein